MNMNPVVHFEMPANDRKRIANFYFVETGQYRIAIKINEKEKTKTIHFAGNHKQYENWFKTQGSLQ